MLTVGDMNFPCKQKKVQQVSSGLQECETIKLNSIPSSSKSGAMDTQADDSRWQGKCRV